MAMTSLNDFAKKIRIQHTLICIINILTHTPLFDISSSEFNVVQNGITLHKAERHGTLFTVKSNLGVPKSGMAVLIVHLLQVIRLHASGYLNIYHHLSLYLNI